MEEEVTVLRVEPLTAALLTIRLASPHHAFSLARSVTTRQPGSVFWLRERLASHDPYCHTPALPPSLLFTLLPSHTQVRLLEGLFKIKFLLHNPLSLSHSPFHQIEAVADFLAGVLTTPEFLSSRAVHLYLQTSLTLHQIEENLAGLRDDEVASFPLVDKRENSR